MGTQKTPKKSDMKPLVERILQSPKVVGTLQPPGNNRYGGYLCTVDIDRVRHKDNALLGKLTAHKFPMVVAFLVPIANTTEGKQLEALSLEAPPPEKEKPKNECSLRRLMSIMDVSKARISQLVYDKVVVRISRGVYDLDASLQNYIEMKKQEALGRGGRNMAEKKTEGQTIKNEDAALDLALKKEELVLKAEANASGFEMGLKVKNALESLTPRVSAELAAAKTPAKVRNILKPEITNILTRLSLNKDTPKRKNGNARSSGKTKAKAKRNTGNRKRK